MIGPKMLRAMAMSLTSQGRAIIAKEAKREQEILNLMCVLPGKYRYEQVEAAINASGVSPRLLYEHASAGYYTREMARLDADLGLPVKEVTSLGGYWQDRLVEVAKQYGKSIEELGDDLERAVEEGNAVGFFISKEELAQTIVLLNGYESVQAAFDFKSSMTKLQHLAGSSTEDIKAMRDAILKMADLTQPEQPPKKASKTPYYYKDRAKWWK